MVDFFAGAGACHKAFSHQLRSEKKVSQILDSNMLINSVGGLGMLTYY